MKDEEITILNPAVENYIDSQYTISDEILTEMERKAVETGMPVVGSTVGRLLKQLALLSGAGSIFELGSGFGYSAYWFALAVGDKGKIVCTDYSDENRNLALGYFDKSGLNTYIDFRTGDSLQLLKTTDQKFDIIFNDIDKEFYPEVVEPACERLKKGGLLISDNVLWYGRVTGGSDLPSTEGVKKYNELVSSNDSLFTTIIPLRDGLSVSMKME